jgi:hypothetical protein
LPTRRTAPRSRSRRSIKRSGATEFATGTVRALRVQETEAGSSLGCEIGDEAGSLLLVFPGRRRIPGIELGARVVVEGMVGFWRRQLAILNPYYELVGD